MTTERIAHDRAVRRHLSGRTFDDIGADPVARAAFERFLEIISEACRHVPDAWKAEHSTIPWRRVADLGNQLRHAYRHVDLQPLWDIYQNDLDPLERAVDAMLAAHAPQDGSP